MKIILMILLSTCLSLATSEYPRFKRKGSPQNGPPRSPPPPQFAKKWGKPPQKMPPYFAHHNRPYKAPPPPPRGSRPPKPQMQAFNMHLAHQLQHPMMLAAPKYQQFPPQPQKNQQITGMKELFKYPIQQHHNKIPSSVPVIAGQQLIQFPQENKAMSKIIHQHQEKPSFISSPSIPAAIEHDYHIQTNNIPMNVNTIKQIGEKGPIHTIPAPNLTPADKPSNMDLRQPQHYQQHQEIRFQQPQYLTEPPQNIHQHHHQYQVTEPSEQAPKQLFRDQIHHSQAQYNPIQDHQQFGTQQQNGAQAYQNVQQPQFYGENNLGLTIQETRNHGINIGFIQPQQDQSVQEEMVFSNSKHFQVLNGHLPTGQPNQNQHTQAIQSSYEQQQPQILTKFVQPSESGYVEHQYQQDNFKIAEEKGLHAEPEYHSFNYDEQAHQAQAKSDHSPGLVRATYSLAPSDEVNKGQNIINSRSASVDPLTQTQIVQSYFGARSGDDVEPDAKPSGTGYAEKEAKNTLFFSSLPSKEAADRLAKLQAAGRVNSSLMQIGNNNNRSSEKETENELARIYAQEENASDEKEEPNTKQQLAEYDEDYAQEDEESQSDEETGFGQKTQF